MFVSEINELGGDKMKDKLYIDITRGNERISEQCMKIFSKLIEITEKIKIPSTALVLLP